MPQLSYANGAIKCRQSGEGTIVHQIPSPISPDRLFLSIIVSEEKESVCVLPYAIFLPLSEAGVKHPGVEGGLYRYRMPIC